MKEHKVQLTISGAKGHVLLIENTIKFIKERTRYLQCNMRFKVLPKAVTVEMVSRSVTLINSFNRKSGVHAVISPRKIVEMRNFITLFCQFDDLVMEYNTLASNNIGVERAIFGLYLKPNNAVTAG